MVREAGKARKLATGRGACMIQIAFRQITSHYGTIAARLAAAMMLAWACVPAGAQTSDVCAKLDNKLKVLGEETAQYKEYPSKADAADFGPSALAYKPSPFRVDSSSDNLPGGGQAWFAIVDKTYSDEKANVCVRLYWRKIVRPVLKADGTPDKERSQKPLFERINILQAFRFLDDQEDKTPKYKVVFDVPKPPEGTRISRDVEFLMVGMTEKDGGEKPFSYTSEETITKKEPAVFVALAFVVIIYALLAWATFNPKDMDGLKGFRYGLYVLSPIRITAGVFGDASISQVQIVLFTIIVGALLMYLWMRTGLLASISKDLLYLLGISAVGAGSAKFTATIKSDLSPEAKDYILAKGWYNWTPVPAAKNANIWNLFLTGGRLDVYKFQVGVFTIVVAAYVVSSGQNDLGDVKISDTMLYLIGISQGVYVGGKAITDRTTRIEDAVKKMQQLEPLIADSAKKAEFDAAQKTAKDEFASLYQLQQA